MATDGGDDRWRNVLDARSITVRPVDGDPVDLQEYLDGLGGGDVTVAWGDVTGKPSTFPPAAHTHTAAQVSDATATGRSVLTAADGAAARSAIGAGTSSLALGTTASTAATGNHTHSTYATTAALSDLAARVQALEDAAAGA